MKRVFSQGRLLNTGNSGRILPTYLWRAEFLVVDPAVDCDQNLLWTFWIQPFISVTLV